MKKYKRNKKGDGTIYKDNHTGKWRAQVTYKENSITKRKSFTANTKREVKIRRDVFLMELEQRQAKGLINSNLTIGEILMNLAEADYRSGTIKTDSYIRRIETAKIINRSEIGNIPISRLTAAQIQSFLFGLREYSDSVIGKVFGNMTTAFDFAIEQHIVDSNPMKLSYIKKPKSIKKKKKVSALTVEEENLLIKQLTKKRFQMKYIDYNSMLLIEMFTGMRMGEIAALKEENIDFENGTIDIVATITKDDDDKPMLGDSTKTPAGARTIKYNKNIEPILKNVVKNQISNPDGLLFYNIKAMRPVSTQQVNCYFKRVCEKAGIKNPGGQHSLRHTFATRSIEAGVPAKVLQKWLGHSDITVTLNTYCDVFEQFDNESVKKIENYSKTTLYAPKVHIENKI